MSELFDPVYQSVFWVIILRHSHYELLFSDMATKLTLSQLRPEWLHVRGHSLLARVLGILGRKCFREDAFKGVIEHPETDIGSKRAQ